MAKAQSGMNAAILIAIISALIIIYIIFLPSDDRLEFIGDNDSDSDDDSDSADLLLDEKEITMSYVNDQEIDHDFPAVNLYTTTESNEIKELNSVYAKNGIFDRQDFTTDFEVKDADNVKNMLISFEAKKAKGRLAISINDHEIFNDEITKVNIEPIKIPLDMITNKNNLKLSVSGVGIAFWSTNEYLLENFKITADITDKSTTASTMTFIIPKSESSNIEKTKLRFNPECEPTNVGTLEILINNQVVYSSVPDCGVLRPLDVPSSAIITGENKLAFRTEKGRYLIDQIQITNELEDTPSYTYYFDLTEEQMQDIEGGNKDANLTFYFADDREDKEAEIIINNAKTYMTRHHKFEWNMNIDRYLEEGSNSIKIIPEENMDVRKLQIRLYDD